MEGHVYREIEEEAGKVNKAKRRDERCIEKGPYPFGCDPLPHPEGERYLECSYAR